MTVLVITCAILLGATARVLSKKSVHAISPLTLALFTQIAGSVLFWVLVWIYPPSTFLIPTHLYLSLAVTGLLWTVVSIVIFLGFRETELSVREILMQSRILIGVGIGVFLLGGPLSSELFLGSTLIVLGITYALWKTPQKDTSWRGILIVLANVVLGASAAALDSYNVQFLPLHYYAALMYSVPLVVLFAFARTHHVKELTQTYATETRMLWLAIIATVAGVGTYALQLVSYTLLPFAVAYPLLQISAIVAVLFAIFGLHERTRIPQKLIGFALALFGALIIKLIA